MTKFRNSKIEEAHEYFKEVVYQAANMEDKGITYADTVNTIEFLEEAKKTLSHEKIEIINGLRKAYEYVIEKANSKTEITYKDAMNINKLIDSYEKSSAGLWRIGNVKISKSNWTPPLLTEEQSIEFFDDVKNINSFEEGVEFCAQMSKKQLFPNGNKRTALCFSNLILIDKDIDFIQINNRIEYTNKLIDFYDDEDKINNFIEEVKKQTQNGEYALDVEKEKNR
ncbi:MAG: hypothetical protein LBV53_00070 [Mycoplasmataceae bacterium]|nr:hypothetical protein [Mycoplasmataceae bacterium]